MEIPFRPYRGLIGVAGLVLAATFLSSANAAQLECLEDRLARVLQGGGLHGTRAAEPGAAPGPAARSEAREARSDHLLRQHHGSSPGQRLRGLPLARLRLRGFPVDRDRYGQQRDRRARPHGAAQPAPRAARDQRGVLSQPDAEPALRLQLGRSLRSLPGRQRPLCRRWGHGVEPEQRVHLRHLFRREEDDDASDRAGSPSVHRADRDGWIHGGRSRRRGSRPVSPVAHGLLGGVRGHRARPDLRGPTAARPIPST